MPTMPCTLPGHQLADLTGKEVALLQLTGRSKSDIVLQQHGSLLF